MTMTTMATAARAPGAVLTVLLFHALPGSAQPPGAAGTWEALWASGIRTERDGTVTVRREAGAVLRLEPSGDSLTGTWTFELPGIGRSVWHVHGRLAGDRLSLVSTEAEIENPPPAGQGRVTRQEWTARLEGDRMEGEHWMVLEVPGGSERLSGPRPWSAVRAADGGAGIPPGTALAAPSGPVPQPTATRRGSMSLAKVIEVLAEGSSIENAVENAVKEASETVRDIQHVYVDQFQAIVRDNQIQKYRVNCKLTFVVADQRD